MVSSFPYLNVAKKHDVPYGLILAVTDWFNDPRHSIAIYDPRWQGWLEPGTQGWGMKEWALDAQRAWDAEYVRRWFVAKACADGR